jgi:hypothetical protein
MTNADLEIRYRVYVEPRPGAAAGPQAIQAAPADNENVHDHQGASARKASASSSNPCLTSVKSRASRVFCTRSWPN